VGRNRGVLKGRNVGATHPSPSVAAELTGGVPTFDELKPLLAEMSSDDLFRRRYRLVPFLERLAQAQLQDHFTVFPRDRLLECHTEAARKRVNEGRDPAAWAAGLKSGRSGKSVQPPPDMDPLVFGGAQELGLLEYKAAGQWERHPARTLWKELRRQLSKYFDPERIDALPVGKRPKYVIEIDRYKLRIALRPLDPGMQSQEGASSSRDEISLAPPASLRDLAIPSSGERAALKLRPPVPVPSRRNIWQHALHKRDGVHFTGFAALIRLLEDSGVYNKFEAYDEIKDDIDRVAEASAPVGRFFGPYYHYYLTPHLQPSRWLYSELNFTNSFSDISAQTVAPFIDGSGLVDHLRAVRAGDSLLLIRGAVSGPPWLSDTSKLWDEFYSRNRNGRDSKFVNDRELRENKNVTSTVAHYEWFPMIGRVQDTATVHGIAFSEPDAKLHPEAGFCFAPCLLSCTSLIPEAEEDGALSESDGAKLLSIWSQLMSATAFRF